MKTFSKIFGIMSVVALTVSCGSNQVTYLEAFTPEESGLNLVKLTDESANVVLGSNTYNESPSRLIGGVAAYKNSSYAYSAEGKFRWNPLRLLDISPDGTKLAYITRANQQDNIMIRNAGAQGASTQRTFRNVNDFCWGSDGKLYFSDRNGNSRYISSVNAEQGSMMAQLTNGTVVDETPATLDGKKVFFTRNSSNGPSIWSLDRNNGTLTSCATGYNVCLIPGNNEAFYCVRNSAAGRSEIWYVNYVKGQETLVLTDQKRSFANPCLPPDGKWILCEGNSTSAITNKPNLDIFVVRTDGTQLTQLTFNPSQDLSPVWAKDGRSIYFISSRANKEQKYNIWRMNFNLDF